MMTPVPSNTQPVTCILLVEWRRSAPGTAVRGGRRQTLCADIMETMLGNVHKSLDQEVVWGLLQ